MPLKYRSVTYPNDENTNERNSFGYKNRGKLKRMDSIDTDQCLISSTQQLQISAQNQSQNQLHLPATSYLSARPTERRRDLSLEGHLRASQFKQAHSATSPITPAKRLLRFSDGSLGKSGVGMHQSFGKQVKSTSCIPTSKRGSPSPRTSNTNLERLVDWQKPSFDRPHVSPNRNKNYHESTQHQKSQKSGKQQDKKLERYYSTDCQESTSSSRSPPADQVSSGPNNGSSRGNSDTRSRRSQFRRAISLFSLSCDKETERERREKVSQKILRPPTRHVYRRGMSGLPIECTSRNLGVVY